MNRVVHTLRHELRQQYRTILVAAVAVAGSILLISLLPWLGRVEVVDLWPGYLVTLPIIGALISASQFAELRSPGQRIHYLLRPATVWEKVGARIVVSSLFLWVVVTAAFFVASLLSVAFYALLGGSMGIDKALSVALAGGDWWRQSLTAFTSYLPIHAIFIFGAVYFRRHPAGLTLLSIVGWVGSYVVIGMIALVAMFGRTVHNNSGRWSSAEAFGLDISREMWTEILPWYLQNPEIVEPMLKLGTVVVFWLLAVLRLRETEA